MKKSFCGIAVAAVMLFAGNTLHAQYTVEPSTGRVIADKILMYLPNRLADLADIISIDLEAGKNLAGAFYQPRLVLMDPDVLATLPDPVFADGMAEVIGCKYDAIVTNPPIRAGKQVIYKMFADAAVSLKDDGALYLVIRKQQGAESCMKYLKTLFDVVEKLDKSGGFWVLKAYEPKNQEGDSNEV